MLNETNTEALGSNVASFEPRTTEKLTARAHETVDRIAASARGAEVGLRTHAAEIGEQAREQEARIKAAVDASSRRARAYLLRNPLLGVGAAFAAGAVIAGLVLRK